MDAPDKKIFYQWNCIEAKIKKNPRLNASNNQKIQLFFKQINEKIHADISSLPECIDKEQYLNWLEVSMRIDTKLCQLLNIAPKKFEAYIKRCYIEDMRQNPCYFGTYDEWLQIKFIHPFFRKTGKSFIKHIPVGTKFYRIRPAECLSIFGNDLQNIPDCEIQKPPKDKTPDGRVNLSGNSVLYLADSIQGARAEVIKKSPPKYILIGEFESIARLSIIDIENLIEACSLPSINSDKSTLADLMKYYMYVFVQSYDTVFHISAADDPKFVYTQSTLDATMLITYYKELLRCDIRGLVWASGRSDKSEKSYAFFNGDTTEFKVIAKYIKKYNVKNQEYETHP